MSYHNLYSVYEPKIVRNILGIYHCSRWDLETLKGIVG